MDLSRDRETIESELRLMAAVRRTVREFSPGTAPRISVIDELLDELSASTRPTFGCGKQ